MGEDIEDSASLTERDFWERQARTFEALGMVALANGQDDMALKNEFAAEKIREVIHFYNSRFPREANHERSKKDDGQNF